MEHTGETVTSCYLIYQPQFCRRDNAFIHVYDLYVVFDHSRVKLDALQNGAHLCNLEVERSPISILLSL